MSIFTLRVWVEGPLQSWGARSRFENRSTELVPTKSAIVGMIANAAGWSRAHDVSALASARFGVRVARYGSTMTDFHTVGADPEGRGVAVASGGKGRLVVTRRAYLMDAAFVVGLASSDVDQLEDVRSVLREPRRPIFLGRRSCPGCGPLVDEKSIVSMDLEAALRDDWEPSVLKKRNRDATESLYVEMEEGELCLLDQPRATSFNDRTFSERRIARLPLRPEEGVPAR